LIEIANRDRKIQGLYLRVKKKKNSDTTNIKFILSKNNKCTVTNAH
jgi:hypothetical protein